MEAVMGSSSPSFKLLSSMDTSPKDDFSPKSLFKSPLHHSRSHKKNAYFDLKLSLAFSSARRAVRPVSLSSSHTQAEVENHGLQLEESQDGFINAAECEPEQQSIRITIQLRRECSFGQNFLIVGDHTMIGSWDPSNAIPLTWSDGHVWTVDLDIPVGNCIKFKLIMQASNGEFIWQPGPDRVLEFWEPEKPVTLCEDWENPDSRMIIGVESDEMAVESSVTAKAMNSSTNGRMEEAIESEGYAINLKEVLESDEGVPVLVPGLSRLAKTDPGQDGSVKEAPKDEPELVNGADVVAQELKMPELDSKGYAIANTKTSSIDENQDSCEEQQIGEEHDHEITNPMKSSFDNEIQWGKNILQKLLSSFGIQ